MEGIGLPKLKREKNFGPKPNSLPCGATTLELTERCNLKCVYCGVSAGAPLKNELSTHEILKFLKEAKKYGVKFIHFSGGEPLIRDDLYTILGRSLKLKFDKIVITTNGTLLNEKHMKVVKPFKENFEIKISLDGASSNVNDRVRGVKGAFNRTLNAIKMCISEGVDTEVLTTITKYNFIEVPKIVKLTKKLGVKWRWGVLSPVGRADVSMMDPVVRDFIKDEEGHKQDFLKIVPPTLKKFVEMKQRKKWLLRYVACGAGIGGLTILSNGNVTLCGFLRDLKVGNIRHHSISYIWERGFAKWRSSIDFSKNKKCASCPLLIGCSGGCLATSRAVSGKVGGTPTPLCAWCYGFACTFLKLRKRLGKP